MSAVELAGGSGKGNFTGEKSLERKACRKLMLTGEASWYIPSSAVSICVLNPSSLLGVNKVQVYSLWLVEKFENCLYFIWKKLLYQIL